MRRPLRAIALVSTVFSTACTGADAPPPTSAPDAGADPDAEGTPTAAACSVDLDGAAETCVGGTPCTGPDLCVDGVCVAGPGGFDRTHGGSHFDAALALAVLPDGGFALAGYTLSKGEGIWDFWLVRTDAKGEHLWDRAYGGAYHDEAHALAALPDGGFALAGYTGSKGAGGNDFWLVRTDGAGEVLWDRTYGGRDMEQADALAALSDGGFALAGYTGSKGAGNDDFWLVRTDEDGDIVWDRTYGDEGFDWPRTLAVLPDGGFALAGTSESVGLEEWDGLIIRTDGEGQPLWEKSYGGSGYDSPFALAPLPDGGFALAGYADLFGTGFEDFWLMRTDAEGDSLWNRNYGGTGFDAFRALATLPDGGFALAGHTSSKEAAGSDFRLLRTDSEGHSLWERTFGGQSGDRACAVAALPNGGFALAGVTWSKGAGMEDMWLVVTTDGAPCDDPEDPCGGVQECLDGACVELGGGTCE